MTVQTAHAAAAGNGSTQGQGGAPVTADDQGTGGQGQQSGSAGGGQPDGDDQDDQDDDGDDKDAAYWRKQSRKNERDARKNAAAAARLAELEQAKQTAEQAAEQRAQAAEAKVQAANRKAALSDLRGLARDLSFTDPADAVRLIDDVDDLLDDDGDLDDKAARKALEALAKSKAYLLKTTAPAGRSGGQVGGGEPPKRPASIREALARSSN